MHYASKMKFLHAVSKKENCKELEFFALGGPYVRVFDGGCRNCLYMSAHYVSKQT